MFLLNFQYLFHLGFLRQLLQLSIAHTHFQKLITLAEKLLEKEVIFKTDLEIIFGKRAFENEYAEIITEDVTDEIPQETNIENSTETQE